MPTCSTARGKRRGRRRMVEHAATKQRLWRVLGLLLTLAATSQAIDAEEASDGQRAAFEEAVGEYRAALNCADRELRVARFRRAELLFGQLAGDPSEDTATIGNPDLYVNWGNAALGAERLGHAVLAYRRALAIAPNHRRAEQNLRHARSLLPEWFATSTQNGLWDSVFSWRRRIPAAGLRWAACLSFLVAAISAAGAVRWRQAALRSLSLGFGVIWLVSLAAVWLGPSGRPGQGAVVIVPDVIARSADAPGSPAKWPHPVPGGVELQIVETRGDWVRVRLDDARDAWLPRSCLATVGP